MILIIVYFLDNYKIPVEQHFVNSEVVQMIVSETAVTCFHGVLVPSFFEGLVPGTASFEILCKKFTFVAIFYLITDSLIYFYTQ